ncbi:hypothetical protein MLD38_007040 [Melastoma candidum]|uniref:Uncharacterized protein n=1 Tax=Melastoma candidum TaxID=119954 RepID=A0ACB9RPY6_9MYRT|nr:hypothetical protein MLD38_007040 [Melastoma candidum]
MKKRSSLNTSRRKLFPPIVTRMIVPVHRLMARAVTDFVEAFGDLSLRVLDLHQPDETVQGKLMPEKKRGVAAIQATELMCGGIVVACIFHHRVIDAYSANMFLTAWAEMSRSAVTSF